MSGERPKAPLWPEGISKVRPVGKHRTEALPKGVSAPVAKRPELRNPGEQTGENPVLKHVDELKWKASLKGEPAPLQPIPAEQQAAERLGKPPPEGVGVVFRSGSSQPEQQGGKSRKPEPLPRSKKARISELIDLFHEEIHLPLLTADLTPEEEAQLNLWANSLSYKELGQEIRKRQEKLDKDFKDQWPPRGLAMP